MEVNQGTLDTLHVAFSMLFNEALGTAASDWMSVSTKVPSSTKRNEYAWLRNMPQLKRDMGESNFENLVRQGYSITNHRYKSPVEIDVDDIEDDNIGTYRTVFQQHADEASKWLTNAVLSLLPMGITSDGQSFDGVNFFSASHPLLDGDTYSNYDNDGGSSDPLWYLLDTKRPVRPLIIQERKKLELTLKNRPDDDNVFNDDVVQWMIKGRYGFGYTYPQLAYASRKDLDETNLEAAIQAMLAFTRDDGTKLNIMPDTIVVGPSNLFRARKLVENILDSDGGSNIHKGSLKIVYSQYVEEVSLDIAPTG